MRKRRAFSLIEVLVVAVVAGQAILLSLPALQDARERAQLQQCRNNLRQLGIAMHNYHDVFATFPPGYIAQQEGSDSDEASTGWIDYHGGTAFTFVLPFVEQAPLYNRFDFQTHYYAGPNADVLRNEIPTYLCPSNALAEATPEAGPRHPEGLAVTDYLLSFGRKLAEPAERGGRYDGIFRPAIDGTCGIRDIRDGTSNTLMIGEGTSGFTVETDAGRWQVHYPWGASLPSRSLGSGEEQRIVPPYGLTAVLEEERSQAQPLGSEEPRPHVFRSAHEDGAHFLFGDGSTRFLADGIDQAVFEALSTRAGGEPVRLDF